MSNPTTLNGLNGLAAQFQQSVKPVDFNASAPTMQPAAHEGASNKIDFRRLHAEIVSRGFVAGYIMGNAPAISFGLVTSKTSDGAAETKIVLRESKPSRVLGVAMSLPANCVQRSGSLASPSEISQGLVDYDPNDKTSMVNQVFPVSAAIGYISAFGGKIPECAITTAGEREHWSTKDILSGNPQVSYVYVKATERKSRTSAQERFSFSLKSTSARKSLYDVGNIVCLRALEHTDVKCNSEKRAMELNDIAFGQWGYSIRKNEPQSKLQKAYNACPTLIWKQNYNIDGKDIAGIGSAFFMAGDKTTSEAGQTIPRQDLMYRPWYHTGDRRNEKAEMAKSIVLRTLRPASDGKKEAMVTTAITFEKDPNNACFRAYNRFIDFLVTNGYTTREKLGKMGGRASKSQQKAYGQLSADQQTSMKSFLARAEVAQGIQDVRDQFINASLERAAQ